MKHTIDLAKRAPVNLKGVLTWAFLIEGRDYFEGFRTLATNGIHKSLLNVFKMLGILHHPWFISLHGQVACKLADGTAGGRRGRART